MNKYTKILLFIIALFVIAPNYVYAQDVSSVCSNLGNYDTPKITELVCTGVRILNYGFLLVGGVFVIMFLFGMYKYATAWGDPKGIQGAQQTVTNAIIGVVICFGAATILLVTGNIVGLNQSFTGGINPFNKLITGICNLLEVADLECN